MTPSKKSLKGKCPLCSKPEVKAYQPFCSKECKNKDLNCWLSGRYAIPGEEKLGDALLIEEDEDN